MRHSLFSALMLLVWVISAEAKAQEIRAVKIPQDGLTLQGRLAVADGAELSDGVVLITHGTMAHMDMELIVNMQSLLAERGISSLVHTLSMGVDRRKGPYDCTIPVRGSMQDDAADIMAWYNWLAQEGAKNITLMGHSRGAVQSATVAAMHKPAGLKSVVMVAPAARRSYRDHLSAYNERHDIDVTALLEIAKSKIASGKGADFIDVPGFMYCGATKMTAKALASYYGPESSIPVKDIVKDIDAPVLVIVGDKDKVVGDIEMRLAPVVDGERVIFSLIEDADHFFYDFAGEDAADIIAEFVNK